MFKIPPMRRKFGKNLSLTTALLGAGLAFAAAATGILDLQTQQRRSSLGTGAGDTIAMLDDLNPHVGVWYLLTLHDGHSADTSRADTVYHLENPWPERQRVALGSEGLQLVGAAAGPTIDPTIDPTADPTAQPSADPPADSPPKPTAAATAGSAAATLCLPWPAAAAKLQQAQRSGLPYAPLCGDRLYLRNQVVGTQTQIERVTDYLRDYVWGGDRIVRFVRDNFFQDRYLETATTEQANPAATSPGGATNPTTAATARIAPAAAALSASAATLSIAAEHLGIDTGGPHTLRLGQWYPVPDASGVFVSAIQPQAIDKDLFASARGRFDALNALDPVEGEAVDYLIAFDLADFDLGFALGTDHPRLGWSPRVPDSVRDARLPGPDGFDDRRPLVSTGMLDPAWLPRIAATFTGGFKREHGAFHYGALAQVNGGSHYGFIEQGTVFSRLQPGLATLYVRTDGRVGMKTWTAADTALLPSIRHARQNGVALLEPDPASGRGLPAPLVTRWGAGNWSGSSDEQLRTLRAGACLSNTAGHQYLLYGFFSTATPSAMARVFAAYACHYAMQLDINALEHTYLAIYTHRGSEMRVQHLVTGMAVIDRKGGNQLAPRFLSFPDDRDFFYLLRRENRP